MLHCPNNLPISNLLHHPATVAPAGAMSSGQQIDYSPYTHLTNAQHPLHQAPAYTGYPSNLTSWANSAVSYPIGTNTPTSTSAIGTEHSTPPILHQPHNHHSQYNYPTGDHHNSQAFTPLNTVNDNRYSKSPIPKENTTIAQHQHHVNRMMLYMPPTPPNSEPGSPSQHAISTAHSSPQPAVYPVSTSTATHNNNNFYYQNAMIHGSSSPASSVSSSVSLPLVNCSSGQLSPSLAGSQTNVYNGNNRNSSSLLMTATPLAPNLNYNSLQQQQLIAQQKATVVAVMQQQQQQQQQLHLQQFAVNARHAHHQTNIQMPGHGQVAHSQTQHNTQPRHHQAHQQQISHHHK